MIAFSFMTSAHKYEMAKKEKKINSEFIVLAAETFYALSVKP